ncbi:cAMP-regulated phosphoprotein/endosulfine conserved region domain-containing protein [Purpureocillium lilacinum]|uniref:mRNA stability protein n=1 Tax=Purpureocillium lilacinum TaxID=33203 RepID=A0A179F7N6_PURLI|nr:cAMP-regulated phosphoprotein/endosulfine conserved region domain-containing protein [Purpureocillium lilacinum]
MSASKDTKPNGEKELRLKHLYGRIPRKGDLLGRKYFDSGDFSLSQAQKSSDAGAVKTGSEHPLREGISQPFSAVPSSSNVRDISQQQEQGEGGSGKARSGGTSEERALDRRAKPYTSGLLCASRPFWFEVTWGSRAVHQVALVHPRTRATDTLAPGRGFLHKASGHHSQS